MAHPDLYVDHCAVMAAAQMSSVSASPYDFLVECEGFSPPELEGNTSFVLRVGWNAQTELTAERVRVTEQPKAILERAAVGLAALLFAHLIPGGEMRVTDQGQRADFWLPRLRRALEISGTQQRAAVPRRHRQKIAQMLANPRRWNGYVFVCCFSAPQGLIRWSYNTREDYHT